MCTAGGVLGLVLLQRLLHRFSPRRHLLCGFPVILAGFTVHVARRFRERLSDPLVGKQQLR